MKMFVKLGSGHEKRVARVGSEIAHGVSSIEGMMGRIARDTMKVGDKILE